MIKPAIMSVLTLGFVYTFKVFDLVWVMTKGGPINSTELVSTYAYRLSFVMGKKQKKGQIGAFICGFIIFVIFIFPLYWMVVTALKTQVEIFEIPTPLWPRNLSLDAFKAQLSASGDTLRGFKNSAHLMVWQDSASVQKKS